MSRIYYLALCTCLLFYSCKKDQTPLSKTKEISQFILKKADGSAFPTDSTKTLILSASLTISIEVPHYADLSHMLPDITFEGKSISPVNGSVQNFTFPVNYTVTAEDGSTVTYKVVVSKRPAPNAIIYMAIGKQIYAIDAVNGTEKWMFPGVEDFANSSPAYYNGVVFAASITGDIFALNANNGSIRWKHETMNDIEFDPHPVANNGILYFSSPYTQSNALIAVDVNTGQVRWQYTSLNGLNSGPTFKNGTIYICHDSHDVTALDAVTGPFKWNFKANGTLTQSNPAVDDNNLYVHGRDSYLYAVDLHTGILKWKYPTALVGSVVNSSATVWNNKVFISSFYNFNSQSTTGVMALQTATGQLVWQTLNDERLELLREPVVAEGKLFVSGRMLNSPITFHLYALDANTGTVAWHKNSNYVRTILYYKEHLYVRLTGQIVKLKASTGDQVFTIHLASPDNGLHFIIVGPDGEVSYDTSSGLQN
jgi:outer membrane protein assembly factor BamB